MKRKGTKIVLDLPEPGFEPQIFSNFPALDLNLRMMRSNLENLLKEIGLYVAQKQFVYIFLQSLYEKCMGPSI